MSDRSIFLEIRNLHVKRSVKEVLSNISFKIQTGEMWHLFGPNGSGKSSLLHAIVQPFPDQQGEILIAGKNRKALTPNEFAQSCALIPQQANRIWPFRVHEFIASAKHSQRSFWNHWSKYAHQALKQTVMHAMHIADITHLCERRIDSISQGEFQRVLVARALAQETKLLLLDEPFASLDLKHKLELKALFQRLHATGYTLLIVHHELTDLLMDSHPSLILSGGCLHSIINTNDPLQNLSAKENVLIEVFGVRVQSFDQPLFKVAKE